jgi:hypothetical protein
MAMTQYKAPRVYVEGNPKIRFEKDDIAASVREALSGFIGEKNTPHTQALMRHHLDNAIAESANSFGRPAKMYMPESSAKKYGYHECDECHNASSIISGMYEQMNDLKERIRRLENTNSHLEREIEYYKMLTEEN